MLLLGAGSAVYSVTVACRKSCLIPRSSLEEGLPDSYVINEKTCRATAALTWHPSKEIIEFHFVRSFRTRNQPRAKTGPADFPVHFLAKRPEIYLGTGVSSTGARALTELLPSGSGPPDWRNCRKKGNRFEDIDFQRLLRGFSSYLSWYNQLNAIKLPYCHKVDIKVD